MRSGIRKIILFLSIVFFAGCASLPVLLPVKNEKAGFDFCKELFLNRPFRAVHVLEIKGPFGNRGGLYGISIADPGLRQIRASLVSAEGMTLFDAVLENDSVEVLRALPPLDKPFFAEGLKEDLFLLFFRPQGKSTRGLLKNGSRVCRYENGGTIDIQKTEKGFEILKYNKNGLLKKKIILPEKALSPEAGDAAILSYGPGSYEINLRLLEYEPE